MPLSNDLISQFVKITKDETKTKPETSTYGTVVGELDGHATLRLDGSDLITPASKTADVRPGDRVTVMIKNHTAVITGNLSSPAARIADLMKAGVDIATFEAMLAGTATVAQLEAVEARVDDLDAKTLTADQIDAVEAVIDILDAGVVTIEDLSAVEAKVDNLKADMLTVAKADLKYALISDLDATNAEISQLSSTHAEFKNATVERLNSAEATIGSLGSTYATIAALNTEKARIGNLETDSAEINTLIFGSATGTTIQTSFANSVIAQLGDAQIKSAMIDSIVASKITSGDILTNQVCVKSSDGRLIISDQTMQISDANRVRVQIGKDASNDYSINIWDASGNLMFSKGGITDSAIKSAIIRNDMVSETANISASKLDIDSLFEEINGSTKTIKSTRVYLDENKQALDVAFKSLSSTVSSQGQTITSQGTAISVIQGHIASKIWQQDIDTAKGEMSTQYSTLSQDLSGFKTTVGNTYATNTRVGNAESSIEQLSNKITANITETTSLGTRMTSVEQTASSLTVKIDDLQIGGRNLYPNSDRTFTLTAGTGDYNYYGFDCDMDMNETYTISADIEVTAGNISKVTVLPYTGGLRGDCVIPENGRIHYTFTKTSDTITKVLIYAGIAGSTSGNGIVIRKVKIERGNKATDWTPAPEDVSADILEAAKSATNFMKLDSAGLVVGNMTTSTLGKNVLIASDSVKIRTGTTENAIFGADLIELAKSNASATISMLNGRFKIYYSSDVFEPGLGVYGVTTDGTARLAFQPLNENNNLTLGWGGYNAKANCTNIYGHNINLIAGNDMAFECEDWKVNIDGNLFAKASTSEFVELIGLSSDDNTAIGHGGYTAAIGKTNIYGNKIQHIVNTKSGSASYKPYYEAGDSFETEWYGAGFISSGSKVVYFSIPLSKPIIGSTTPNVTVANATTGKGGLQIRQDSNYVFGSSSTEKATPSSYSAKVVGNGNFVQIEATMANTTNAINNAPCGINAFIKITFS